MADDANKILGEMGFLHFWAELCFDEDWSILHRPLTKEAQKIYDTVHARMKAKF